MLPLPLAVLAQLQLLSGIQLISLGQVVELPADRAFKPDNDSWPLLCSHVPILLNDTNCNRSLTESPNSPNCSYLLFSIHYP